MISHKRIVFFVALAFAISVSTISVATLSRRERTAAAPLRIKVLRRKDQTHMKPTAAEIAAHKAENERKLKIKEVKDLPVKIMEVRNLQSDTWYKDLEIEVKNVSGKPIYHIFAWLQFPDVYGEGADRISGVTVEFGSAKYTDLSIIANPLDPLVKPGDKCVLTIPEQYWGGLRWKQEHTPGKVRRFDLKFAVISYGDGTGFAVDRPQDHRIKKSRAHHGKALRSPPQDGCGSCSRYVAGPPLFRCWDYSRDRACPARSTTTSSTAPCSLSRSQTFDCDNDGVEECYHEEIYSDSSCPGYSPTPTPTPTPEPTPPDEPTPTPTPTPTPCPRGSFNPNPDGSCPINSNKINGCCVCQERNTNCERFGQGTLNGAAYCFWVEELCDCYNLEGKCSENPRPLATPNPTPTPGGGGGGDQPPQQPCTHYYWVEYRSYDDGESWQEVDRWYAGCW